jgi:hypothetical protein
MKKFYILGFVFAAVSVASAQQIKPMPGYPVAQSLASYKTIKLSADVSKLSQPEKDALGFLIEAARIADEIFWIQAFGDKKTLLDSCKNDTLRKFIELNYGPWDRLNNNKPFVQGFSEKAPGANFYPKDMTDSEWNVLSDTLKHSPYTIIVRNGDGKLEIVNYNDAYREKIAQLMHNLNMAANMIMPYDMQLANFIQLRGMAIMQNDYNPSDVQWLGLLKNTLDIIIGPIENYEDERFGKKTAFESYVLIRDKEWGAKLDKYVSMLPELQKSLPVDAKYRPDLATVAVNPATPVPSVAAPVPVLISGAAEEMPKSDPNAGQPGSSLAVFDVVYYAGHSNAGSKTIAVNLPNDEVIQEQYGTRRSQLKNVMKAKFDNMVLPISKLMIDDKQLQNVKFDAFFNNVMFHEVAHGLGIKNTVNGKGTVRDALGAGYSPIEECKADVLGLYMVTKLHAKGELPGLIDDYYVTFVASVFRSARFGAASAHGRANMIIFNTLLSRGAINRNNAGKYVVNVAVMRKIISELAAELLVLQGDGSAEGVKKMLDTRANIGTDLAGDLSKIEKAGIPVDLIFEQGPSVLGLDKR